MLLLYIYHLICHKMYQDLQQDIIKYTSTKLRMWNEAPTLILFSVVFLVVLKSAVNWIYGLIGIIVFGIVMMLAIRMYKRYRERPNA